MTVEELAEYLRLTPRTIRRKFRRGELPGVRIGRAIRFKRDVIDAWLRVMSVHWDSAQRSELRKWAEQFAQERGIREEDVPAAIERRRYGRRSWGYPRCPDPTSSLAFCPGSCAAISASPTSIAWTPRACRRSTSARV